MRKALLPAFLLVLGSAVLGATVLREPIANAGQQIANVFVTNDAAHPVPVRDQNVDAGGNLKVHEQGTADVNVTNTSLPVAEPVITDGGGAWSSGGGEPSTPFPTVSATALSIHMTTGAGGVQFLYQGHVVAHFLGPSAILPGQSDIDLALTRPIEFDQLVCFGSLAGPGGSCAVSWVGAKP